MKKIIAVCGSDKFDECLSEHALQVAEEVGKKIAQNDAILLCGGRGGIMEAACRGAKSEGSTTLGILPFSKEEANEYVDIPLPTHFGHGRNFFVAKCADAVIGISGQWGTLNELSTALILEKPTVVITGTGGCSDLLSEKIVAQKMGKTPMLANTPDEAMQLIYSSDI